jgi:hypothetical protein
VSGYASAPTLLGGWSFVAVILLAVLIGVLLEPGYLQVLMISLMESLLVASVLSLARLLA